MQATVAITCLFLQGAIAIETSNRVTLEIGVSGEVGKHIRRSQKVLMHKTNKTLDIAKFDARSSSQEGKRNQTSHAALKRKTSHKRSWRRRLKRKKQTNDVNTQASHAGFLRKASQGGAIVVNSHGDVSQTRNAMRNNLAASGKTDKFSHLGLSADTLNASGTIHIGQQAALGSIQSHLWHTVDPHNGMWRHSQCMRHGKSFIPELASQQTDETSAPLCQRRCRSVQDCAHFSFRTDDCTCLLHGANATEIEQAGVLSGPPSCIAWQTISSEFSCQDAEGVTRLAVQSGVGTLEQCKEACVLSEECTAIDWFSQTGYCSLFDRACDNPTLRKDGSSSHVLLQPLRKTDKGEHVDQEYFQEEDDAPVQGRRFYVGVMSAPGNKCKRDKIRQTWKRELDRNPNITVEFIVGHTALEKGGEHVQGQTPTCQKYALEHQLQVEELEYGDMRRVAIPELYANLIDKVVAMFDIAIQRRYAFIFKIDDDFALRQNAMSQMDRYNSTQFLYVGWLYWSAFAVEQMRASDGSFAPYMGGPCYALSWTLANSMFVKHRQHTMNFLSYASSSEDVTLGHWVHFEKVLGVQIATETLAFGDYNSIKCDE